jgi:hypothetical protein
MQMLPTMLSGSQLMVHLMNGVMIDGAASNTTVTSANIMADKVRRPACALLAACTQGKGRHRNTLQVLRICMPARRLAALQLCRGHAAVVQQVWFRW